MLAVTPEEFPVLLIDGLWLSLFEILMVTESVTLLPPVSVAVAVKVSVEEPKL